MALFGAKKAEYNLYPTNASYMGCVTYFNTITHPLQNLRTPSPFLRTLSKIHAPLKMLLFRLFYGTNFKCQLLCVRMNYLTILLLLGIEPHV